MSVLVKAAQAIEELGSSQSPTRLSVLAEALDLPKSSVHRLVKELVELGLVNKCPDGGYAIGHRLLKWGHYAESHVGLRSMAAPILRRLRDETSQSVLLAVPMGTVRTVVATEPGKTLRPVMVPVGHQSILGIGASGKVLYAYATEETRQKVQLLLSEQQRQQVPTATEMAEIRERGWSATFGEMEPDLAGMSVPMMAGDECLGALVLAGSSSTFTYEMMTALVPTLRAAAEGISTQAMGTRE